jgi:hypothetical protein
MQRITPFLWFDGNAEGAMNFYVSVFKNSKVGRVTRYGEAGPGLTGTVRHIPARWARILRTQRRPAISLHAGHLLLRKLRDAASG